MTIQFYKYQGTGNDFVIIDNRNGNVQLNTKQINHICDRRFGIGADGLMLLNTLEGYDFEMKYYNADGKESSMCGNGGRCLTRFAYDMGIHKTTYHFLAIDGEHDAEMDEHGWIRLKMKDVNQVTDFHGDTVLNTGSPHYIKAVQNIMELDVFHEGRSIRNSKDFITEGINVNFVEPENKHIIVRTYERGVEDETYSCGTGVTAAAIVFAHNEMGFNRVEVKTKGGNLAVEFDKLNDQQFRDVWLCGPAEFVYKGEIAL
ncbi:MAG TPA: diaminopimelate epimerase [Chitinophagaceae bacterium]|nr:diaminopimelate epimerase [Chitinophagaceae bacterium]